MKSRDVGDGWVLKTWDTTDGRGDGPSALRSRRGPASEPGGRGDGEAVSVYVDSPLYVLWRMRMCHMLADSTAELLAMADAIGMRRSWLQKPGKPDEHFDVCKAKRETAIGLGAIPVPGRVLAQLIRSRRVMPPTSPTAEGEGVGMTLVTCETAAALVVHLRRLRPGEQPRLSGITSAHPAVTLCGSRAAWDTRIPLAAATCRDCREKAT